MGQEQSKEVDASVAPCSLKDRSLDSIVQYIKDGRAKNIVIMVSAYWSSTQDVDEQSGV